MSTYIASIDQGTTSTRCLFFNTKTLKIVGKHQHPHTQITPHPGWLEHDAEQIFHNAIHCINEGFSNLLSNDPDAKVIAVGVTNQRETTVAWSRSTGKPLCNALVWSDTRTQALVTEFTQTVAKGDAHYLQKRCGLPLSTYFSAFKMQWMLNNVPAVRAAQRSGDLMFGTIDSWLVYRLTNRRVHATDPSNASRTLLLSLETPDRFDPDLCQLLDIPHASLPQVLASDGDFGCLAVPGIVSEMKGVPIRGVIGDQQGSLVGQMCFSRGDAKNTYGTGCFLLVNTGSKPQMSKSGLLTTVGYRLGKGDTIYALEGSIDGAGATMQWMMNNLNLYSHPREADQLAASVTDSAGVVFVPAFGGLLTPHWRPDARATIVGLTYRATKAHIVRAALEGIAMRVAETVAALQADSGLHLRQLNVDGGLVNSRILMQMQADILGVHVAVPTMLESTALGAALCAGIGVGHWQGIADVEALAESLHEARFLYSPQITKEVRSARIGEWKRGLDRSLGWAKL